MTVIVERPIRQHVALESFVTEQNPFILDTSWLGKQEPGGFTWGIRLGDAPTYTDWEIERTNLFRDPGATNISSFGVWGGTGATGVVSVETVGWSASGNAVRFTRTSPAGSIETPGARLSTLGLTPEGTYTVEFELVTNRDATIQSVAFGGGSTAGWAREAGTGSITTEAGEPTHVWMTFTVGSGADVRARAGWPGQESGDWAEVSNVIVYEGVRTNAPFFMGDTDPDGELERTRWLGAANASASVWETRELTNPEDSALSWNEFGDDLLAVSIRRGGTRDGISVNQQAGMLTVQLRDFEIDPENPTFVVDQPVRFTAVIDDTRHVLFTGRCRDIQTDWIRVTGQTRPIPVTAIVAVDNVATLDDTTRYGAMPEAGFETFRGRIGRLSRSTAVPIDLPDDADFPDAWGDPYLLGRTVYESSLSNHLTLACNTAGAMWWVDPTGHVRFQPRYWDEDAAILIASTLRGPSGFEDPYPEGTLQMLAPVTDAGTNSQINASIIRVKSAEPDPEDPSNWLAVETDEHGQDWERPNRIPTVLETNTYIGSGPAQVTDHNWLRPYREGWTNMLSGIRWNAQQNLSRLPDLEIGASIKDERGGTHTGPWNKYLVIGVQHTITASRWIVDLTLIGADDDDV